MRPLIGLILSLWSLHGPVIGEDAPISTFEGATATSVNPGTTAGEFDAANALSVGSSYWCSEGGLGDDDDVVWRAWFKDANDLKGLKITWVEAPKQVKIVASSDRQNERILVDWRATPSKAASYSEVFQFPEVETVEEIRIHSRGLLHQFIAIEQVTPIAAGMPIFMLLAGITSGATENCLMVADGNFEDGSLVVLDDCEYALAAGDGRALWQQSPSGQIISATTDPSLCLTLKDGIADGSESQIVLQTCETAQQIGDGRSAFEFKPNSQIGSRRKNDTCLSLRGSGVGMSDILKSNETYIPQASSVADLDHSAINAFTEDRKSYWASAGFSDSNEHNVIFDIDLLNRTAINKVDIDWEYPPLAYSIGVSDDGIEFITAESIPANPSNHTLDDLGHAEGRWVRISMHRPHPMLGMIETAGKKVYLYGIVKMSLLTHRLAVSTDLCSSAGRSPDARDKWFRIPVHNFDSATAKRASSIKERFSSTVASSEASAAAITDALTDMQKCSERVVKSREQLNGDQQKKSRELTDRLDEVEQARANLGKTTAALGTTVDNPAKSCEQIRATQGLRKVDGFYYIQTDCAPRVLRLYCEMDSGLGYMFYNGTSLNSQKSTYNDLDLHCASQGLESLKLGTVKQFRALQTVLKSQGFPPVLQGIVPLAFDLGCDRGACSKSFSDLGSLTDVTGILTRFLSADAYTKSTAAANDAISMTGLEDSGLSLTNWRMAELLGIFCTTPAPASSYTFSALLDCETTVASSRIFQGGVNTNFRVSCPSSCETISHCPIFGGDESVYSDSSSLCRAAIHAGLDPTDFNVALESPHREYAASRQNGIESQAFSGPSRVAVRLSSSPQRCPVLDLLPQLSGDGPRIEPRGMTKGVATEDEVSTGFKRGKALELTSSLAMGHSYQPPNEETDSAANRTLALVDLLLKMDRHAVLLSRQATAETLSAGRGSLKPIETTLNKVADKSMNFYANAERLEKSIESHLARDFSLLEDLSTKQTDLSKKNLFVNGFTSWSLADAISAPSQSFADFFELVDPGAQSSWALATTFGERAHEKSQVVVQSSAVASEVSLESIDGEGFDGAVAFVDKKSFYDEFFTGSFFIQNPEDVIALIFRASDHHNFQALMIRALKKRIEVRLVRVIRGHISQMSQLLFSEIFHAATWIDFKIKLARARITVDLGVKSTEQFITMIDELDEFLTAGTIGLAVLKSSGPVAFDALSVEASCCQRHQSSDPQRPQLPTPPHCAFFEESYKLHPQSIYSDFLQTISSSRPPTPHQVKRHVKHSEAGDKDIFAAKWTQTDHVGGRLKALKLQSKSDRNFIHAIAIKSPHRGSCLQGQVSFDFNPLKCTDPQVGVLLRWDDDDDFLMASVGASGSLLEAREGPGPLRKIKKEALVSLADRKWQRLTAEFTERKIKVAYGNRTSDSSQLETLLIADLPPLHRTKKNVVGLAVRGCSEFAVDRFTVMPLMEPPTNYALPRFEQVPVRAEKRVLTCETAFTPDNRETLCSRLLPPNLLHGVPHPNPMKSKCLKDFCNTCCDLQNAFGSHESELECQKTCGQIELPSNIDINRVKATCAATTSNASTPLCYSCCLENGVDMPDLQSNICSHSTSLR